MPDLIISDVIRQITSAGTIETPISDLLAAFLAISSADCNQFPLSRIDRAFLDFDAKYEIEEGKEEEEEDEIVINSLLIALATKFPAYCSKYWITLLKVGQISTALVQPLIAQLVALDNSNWIFSRLIFHHCSRFESFRSAVREWLHSNDSSMLEISNFISTSRGMTLVKYWIDILDSIHIVDFETFNNFPFNKPSFVICAEKLQMEMLCVTLGLPEWTTSYIEIINLPLADTKVLICWVLCENSIKGIFLNVEEVTGSDAYILNCTGILNSDVRTNYKGNTEGLILLKSKSEEEARATYERLQNSFKKAVLPTQENLTQRRTNLQPNQSKKTSPVKLISDSPELSPFLNQSFETSKQPQLSTKVNVPYENVESSPFIESKTPEKPWSVIEIPSKVRSSLGTKPVRRSSASNFNNVEGCNSRSTQVLGNRYRLNTVLLKNNVEIARVDIISENAFQPSKNWKHGLDVEEKSLELESYSMSSPTKRILVDQILENEKVSTNYSNHYKSVILNNDRSTCSSKLKKGSNSYFANAVLDWGNDQVKINKTDLRKRKRIIIPTSSLSESWENEEGFTASTTLIASAGYPESLGKEQKAIFEGFSSISSNIINKLNSMEEQITKNELKLKTELELKLAELRSEHAANVKILIKTMNEFAPKMD